MAKRTVKDTPSFIEKANAVHGGRFGYDRSEYTASRNRLTITCVDHGDFDQVAADHLRGVGCPTCAGNIKSTASIFRQRAHKVHGDRYGYDGVVYVNTDTPVQITCREHGDFPQTPYSHLSGHGCPVCSGKMRSNTPDFIAKARAVHGDRYLYDKTVYENALSKVIITCPIHGDFEQTPNNHLSGFGCAHCAGCAPKSHPEFLEQAAEIHGDRYTYETEYVRARDKIRIVCSVHGVFEQRPADHLHLRQGCPDCWSSRSSYEHALEAFLLEHEIKVVACDRKRIAPLELDLVLPDFGVAIEVNGLRFHTDRNVAKSYHHDKWAACQKAGLRLLHVNEDEWLARPDAIRNKILNLCGRSQRGAGARKLAVRRIDLQTAREFTERYHIQGRIQIVEDAFGAYDGDRLVAVVTFSRQRGTNLIELSRFCTDGAIYSGVFSKIFKYAVRENGYTHITSYADRRYSDGNLYRKTGFAHTGDTPIDYRYVKGKHTFSKRSFTKTDIKERFGLTGGSEREMMQTLGYDRIYDCGKMRFEWWAQPREATAGSISLANLV